MSKHPVIVSKVWACCLAAGLSLLSGVAAGAADAGHRLELGFGVQTAWGKLDEAGDARAPFALKDEAAFGVLLGFAWRLSERASLELEIANSEFASSLDGVTAFTDVALVGMRYRLPALGSLAPYLRGAYGGARTRLEADGGGAVLDLKGKAALMGLGLRLPVSPRIQFDLELDHVVINYNDAALVLENVYAGTRLDKAGSVTRVQFAGRWLFW